MTDIRQFKNEAELKWGEISKERVLKKMYKNKSTEKMTDKEIERMLEDLI